MRAVLKQQVQPNATSRMVLLEVMAWPFGHGHPWASFKYHIYEMEIGERFWMT